MATRYQEEVSGANRVAIENTYQKIGLDHVVGFLDAAKGAGHPPKINSSLGPESGIGAGTGKGARHAIRQDLLRRLLEGATRLISRPP